MEHESFEDEATAAQMNEQFVCIKVDREERPDLDAIYMDAVVALTGHGGWPMTVFLTPEGEPFFGGTYYPPAPRHGLPSFRQVLDAVADAYRERREDIAENARRLVEAVRSSSERRAVERAADRLDPLRGCARAAPRASTPSTAASAARRSSRPPPRSSSCCGAASSISSRPRSTRWRPAACTTSSAAASTATRSTPTGSSRTSRRCSTTTRCSSPRTSTRGSSPARSGIAPSSRRRSSTCSATSRLPEGGFASSQDADTEGVEGLTYTWTEDEGVPGRAAAPVRARPLDHPRRAHAGAAGAPARGALAPPAARPRRQGDRRLERAGPRRARGGRAAAAQVTLCYKLRRRSETSCSGELSAPDGRLFRTWRNGQASIPGFLEDYADVAHGLYELHVATGELRWLEEANRLARLAVDLFADERRGGFFMTARDAEELVARKKDLDDNPVPSGNSMLAFVLLRLARIYGDDELEHRAAGVLRLLHTNMSRIPSAFGWALCALDLYLSPPRELAIIGSPEDEVARARARAVRSERGRRLRAGRDVPLLAGKTRVDGKPTLYVCERFACRAPVTEL